MSASRFAMINTLVSYALGGYKPRQCTVSDYMNCLFGNNAEYQQERHEFKIRNNFKGINKKFIIWAFKNIWPKIAQEGEPKTLDEIIERYEIEDHRADDLKTSLVNQLKLKFDDKDLFQQADEATVEIQPISRKELKQMIRSAMVEVLRSAHMLYDGPWE